jgi:hypothetical protein
MVSRWSASGGPPNPNLAVDGFVRSSSSGGATAFGFDSASWSSASWDSAAREDVAAGAVIADPTAGGGAPATAG